MNPLTWGISKDVLEAERSSVVPEILWSNTVSGVNSNIVHLDIVKRVDLMVSVLSTKTKQTEPKHKGEQGKFWKWWTCLLPRLWRWFQGCMLMTRLIQSYRLHMYNLCVCVCIHYTLRKFLQKRERLSFQSLTCYWFPFLTLDNSHTFPSQASHPPTPHFTQCQAWSKF